MAERVLAAVAHGRSADAEVEGSQLDGRVEVTSGRLLASLLVQPRRPAVARRGPGGVRRRARPRAAAVGYDALADPLPQRLVVTLGVDLGEVLELVVAGRDRRRLRDAALLVEPHRRGDVDDPEDVGEAVVRVEDGGHARLAGPVAHALLVVVERDGDQVEAQAARARRPARCQAGSS